IAELGERFQSTKPPDDLRALNAALVQSLNAAAVALDRLSRSANACAQDMASSERCQSPFAAASTSVSRAYASYLATRNRISEQIRDSDTLLPVFVVGRAP